MANEETAAKSAEKGSNQRTKTGVVVSNKM